MNDVNKRKNLKVIEAHYASLWKLLLPTDNRLLDKKLKLLQLSTQIFRRFQQRSVELIRLLHFLDQESSTQGVPSDARDEVRMYVISNAFFKEFSTCRVKLESFRTPLNY